LSEAVADGELRQVDPRSIQQQRIEGLIVTAGLSLASLVGVVIFLLSSSGSRTLSALVLVAWLLVTGSFVAVSLVFPPVRYRHLTYRLDPGGMQIRRGVFWRSIVDVPCTRIQHTDVQQGPLERAFGLATLILHTAGTQHAVVPLAGLEHGVALRIRDWLLQEDDG
jgi:membrane protein YdbS with pleckstrin-like domain